MPDTQVLGAEQRTCKMQSSKPHFFIDKLPESAAVERGKLLQRCLASKQTCYNSSCLLRDVSVKVEMN
jgi:hypothetical protein